METKFKTFVTKDRTEFLGSDYELGVISDIVPVTVFPPDATKEQVTAKLNLNNQEDIDWLFSDNDLVTFEITEVK